MATATQSPYYYYTVVITLSVPVIFVSLACIGTEFLSSLVGFALLIFSPSTWNSVYGWFSPPYLYVVLNMVIVTLGIKSGALNNIDSPTDNCFPSNVVVNVADDSHGRASKYNSDHAIRPAVLTEILSATERHPDHGTADGEVSEEDAIYGLEVGNEKPEEEADEEGEALSAEELYVKAEAFIENFHRQLSLQRVDSWKRMHGCYAESG